MPRRRAMAAAALGSAAALVLPLAPAQAAAPSYVALGDSYSSGTGTRDYLADGTSCLRSAYAYPSLVAAARGYALNLRACSGAKVADVTTTQLAALSASTAYVSISVGGNDAGFADVLTECAQPGWMSDCNGAVDDAQSFIRSTLPSRLATLYSSIRAKAPNARVTVVGYPRIFDGEDCNAFTWFSPTEESRLNATADLVNSVTAQRAAAAGFSFANPTARFVGHAVCDSPEWINGLSNPIVESYHPKKEGHAYGYAPTVSPYLTGATLRVTAGVLRTAAADTDRLTTQQRGYAALDRRIRPETVAVPDLHSARALAAAARIGLDVDDRAAVDAADRTASARQAAEHRARAGAAG
ncbi:SGNH/GDSL hydrolase family protein [Phycicoccus duodecadis]|uniref:GDSL-like lipase/acylhydrolase family protein n=1 Tax=Phycicoccus duodecadis TaxID=173053 RepID=A0A2N3YLR1_9MICO|nr:SGNH/GDSL hydrolase family protein [Phycicoccus duodecadis]PKW27749.1 GDSL-like lipase/acylhydrolase family protein [Phycicoccus duodecadis]